MAAIGLWAVPAVFAVTLDPPHNATNSITCESCHIAPHDALGDISNAVGNANLCLSCHMPGGSASAKARLDVEQALAGPGLPAGVTSSGTSHRWDSGLAGHVEYVGGAAAHSSGTVQPVGDYTGRVAKAYTLTIAQSGDVGGARFNWIGSLPGGGAGSNLLCGANVTLDQGLGVTFVAGPLSPAFRAGDRWDLYARPDVRPPTNALLLANMGDGRVSCSTCHDEHSQTNAPFDVTAPAYAGEGTGLGRHCQRVDNHACAMCTDCHAARNVTNSAAGSHPVGVTMPTNGFYRTPTFLPLEKGAKRMWCLTCHDIHNSASSDGDLLRIPSRTALCVQCHTLADTATPAAHFSTTNGMLWPGGQYGSSFPARTDPAFRGTCVNCHAPHGWPDATNPVQDYARLLVENEENLCFTCHDNNGPAKSVKDEFAAAKTVHHPVVDSDPLRHAGRSVECTDCHNPHKTQAGLVNYTNTATSARNQVGNPTLGVTGVAVNYSGLGNFVAPDASACTAITNSVYEYQICFKCHSLYGWGTNGVPTGISANGSVANPVETDLAQQFSPNNKSGHPVVTGLDNYPNSTAVDSPAKKGLQAVALKAPWNTNIGQQTMQCSDCHTTDAASPAAQGPHGSASQFMLRGPNAANWPNVTVANYLTSWCANCHVSQNNVHGNSNHSGFACYRCHIVVPHGGKLSRLIADNDTMPARYAYNNTLNTQYIQGFTKAAGASYSSSNCKAQCDSAHSGRTPSENW